MSRPTTPAYVGERKVMMSGGTDVALSLLGTSWWSLLHLLTIAYSCFLLVPHIIGGAFLAPKVPFTCRTPIHSSTSSFLNTSTTNNSYYTITNPDSTITNTVSSTSPNDECMYRVGGGDEVERWVKCTEFDFDNSTFTTTVTSEFGLTCGREYLRTTYQSIYMFGIFVGSPVNGFLSDRYGRKRGVTVGVWLYLLVALGSCWLPLLPVLLLSRFLLGMMHSVVCYTGYILAVEVAEPRLRTAVGFAIYVAWAGATIWWGILAYLIRSWRRLQLMASLPGLLLLPAIWMMDESPRWLVVKGRREEALKVLERAARWHRVALPSRSDLFGLVRQPPTQTVKGEDESEVEGEEGKRRRRRRNLTTTLRRFMDSAFILYRTPRLRRITLLLYLDYFVASMVYYGLSLSGDSLSNNPFIYMGLTGLMELPAYTITIPLVQKLGRRIPGFSCFLFCGVALVALAFIPKEYSSVKVSLAMVGKVAITGAYQIVVFFSTELFPTEVRSRGIGTSFMMSRIGSILSPIIVDVVGSRHAWAPSVVFGVASLLAAAVTLLLPEMLGSPMADTIADLEIRQWAAATSPPRSRCQENASKEKQEKYDEATTNEEICKILT